ncbi:hypothetical protein [Rhizobium sp. 18055]|uniref:hypothetical protein n=1 Tax=Rhizobium sp. 18055 TaxID=2681403 RepID=UPI0013599E37|nr:hypothetical protein [Rhizobium sp. 18055]
MALWAIMCLLIGAVALYFCVGITLRFLWEWWILIISTPTLATVGLMSGWIGASVSLALWLYTLSANNDWHSRTLYFAGAEWLERTFSLSDA